MATGKITSADNGNKANWIVSNWPHLTLLASVYFVAAFCSVYISRLPGGVSTLWVANALAIVLVLGMPANRRWQGYLAAQIGCLGAYLSLGYPVLTTLAISVCNVSEIILAVSLISRLRLYPTISLNAYLLLLTIAAGLAPLLGGTLASTVLHYLHKLDFGAILWAGWSRSAVGATVVLPLALTLSREAVRNFLKPKQLAIWAALVLSCVGVAILTLLHTRYPFVIMGIPMIIAAIVVPPLGMALISLLTAISILAVAANTGLIVSAIRTPAEYSGMVHLATVLTITIPFCVSLLVDQLKKERARLSESEARFRRAMADSAIGMAIVSPSGTLLEVNRALCDMLGYTPEELQRRSLAQITHPDDLALDQTHVEALLRGEGDSYRIEKRYIAKDGRAVWSLLAVSLVRDEQTGAPLYFISQIENIDGRKQAEAALADAESRWNFALESAGQGVWDTDLLTGRTFYSRTYKAMLGYAEHEWTDASSEWFSRLHPDDLPIIQAADRAHQQGRTAMTEGTFRMRHKDGHWVWILDRGRVIARAADGQALRMIGTHTDITAQKAAEAELRTLTRRVRMATRGGGIGLWEVDVATGAVWWDSITMQLFDITPEEFRNIDTEWRARIHPADLLHTELEFKAALEDRRTKGSDDAGWEYRIIRRNGDVRHIRARAQLLHQPDGSTKLVGANWDITDQKRLADALYEEKERLRITLHSMGDAVISTNAEGRITYLNPIAEIMTGWSAAQAFDQPIIDVFRVVDDETGADILNPVTECLRTQRPYYLLEGATLIRRDGDKRAISDSAAPILSPSGDLVGAVLIFQDVTKARAAQRDLTFAALHDALTGLANRLAFERALTDAVTKAGPEGRVHALCFIDLDRFKIVNDTAGHAAGDALLREISAALRSTVRGHDLVARLGGDEFAVLLHDCQVEDAERIATKLVQAVKGLRFNWGGRAYDVGASAGVAVIDAQAETAAAIMAQADMACYASKSGGRGMVSVYQPGSEANTTDQNDPNLVTILKSALAHDQFVLFAHETHDLQAPGLPLRHLDVLIRMIGADGKLIEPSRFIPAAERYDMIGQLDRWVIHTVLARYGAQIMAHDGLVLSVNLSAQSLTDRLIWPYILEHLQQYKVSPDRLNIELTETSVINNIAAAERLTSTARAAGCHVTLDDFGSGLSSFSYLKRFQIDHIKIDGSFVRNMLDSPYDHTLVKAIHQVGQTIGVRTIAEFIQDQRTITALAEIGVDFGQGYVFGQPRPLETILSGLDKPPSRVHEFH